MKNEFKIKIKTVYKIDEHWKKILNLMKSSSDIKFIAIIKHTEDTESSSLINSV